VQRGGGKGRGDMSVVEMVGMGLCFVLVGACARQEAAEGPGGMAELRVAPEAVGAGDQVMLTLVNRSDGDLGYNLCPAVLDRREGGEWVEERLRPAEVCTMELRVLPAGDSSTYHHTVPSALRAGEYRFRVGIEAPLSGGRVEVASGPFEVR
jgi:hypothetical protein